MVTATFSEQDETYAVTMDPVTAHLLVWGGGAHDLEAARNELRIALVEAEDTQMSGATYSRLFNQPA